MITVHGFLEVEGSVFRGPTQRSSSWNVNARIAAGYLSVDRLVEEARRDGLVRPRDQLAPVTRRLDGDDFVVCSNPNGQKGERSRAVPSSTR